jgi:hypothetical protein
MIFALELDRAASQAHCVETSLFETEIGFQDSGERNLLSDVHRLRKISIPDPIQVDRLLPAFSQQSHQCFAIHAFASLPFRVVNDDIRVSHPLPPCSRDVREVASAARCGANVLNFATIEVPNDMGIAFDKGVYTPAASVFVPLLSRERVSGACIKGEAHNLILDDRASVIFHPGSLWRAEYLTNCRANCMKNGFAVSCSPSGRQGRQVSASRFIGHVE